MQVPQFQSSASSAVPEISSSAISRNKYELARGDFAVTLADRQHATAASVEASKAGRPEQIEADHAPAQETRSDASADTGRAAHAQDTARASAPETSERAAADLPANDATPRASADSATGAATAEPVARVTVESAGGPSAVDYMADAVRLAANSTVETAARVATGVVKLEAPQTLESIPPQVIAEAVTLDAASVPLPQGPPEKSAVLAVLLESKPAFAAAVAGGTAATQELEGLAAVLQDIAALSEETVTIQTSRVQAVSASGETPTGTETGAGGTPGQGAGAGQILAGPHAAEFAPDTAVAPEATVNTSGLPEAPPERATLGTLRQFTVRGIRYLTSRDGRTLTIKLVPASLGELHLEVASTRDGLYIRLVSAHSTVREVLGGELQNLRDVLVQSDLDIAGITIASELGTGQAQVGHDSGAAGTASGSPAQGMADEEIEGAVPVAMAAAPPHEGTLDVVV
ncbi:MAG: hypothetical protein GWP08_09565 [Nitrospiraceae bacterium]|nr:hypothetical protein [Nitrospiraceae bacterium]